ncbi:MAG: hypothetical protein ABI679_00880 [Gemmatimonadota bacterium]
MSRLRLLTAVAAAFALAACNKPADSKQEAVTTTPPPPPAPQVITMTAHEYAYEGPDTISAGMTTFRLANTGTELHHMQLVRLNDGKTVQDLMAAPMEGPAPAWAIMVGGPNAAAPGDTANATLHVEPGRYAMLCFIPSSDGKPHVAKGMLHQFEVIPSTAEAAAMPSPDVTITLADYAFNFSTPITAGRHTIKVENTASQVHELVIIKLDAGKKAADFTSWAMTMKGPPPGRPMSGMGGLTPGQTAYVTDDFTPGSYAIVCFVPDVKDGKAHLAHGMVQDLTVS